MNNQQHGDYHVETDNSGFSQKPLVGTQIAAIKEEIEEQGSEQLHIEEMAELREKIERLRRAFLQETNPQIRILAPIHNLYRDKET